MLRVRPAVILLTILLAAGLIISACSTGGAATSTATPAKPPQTAAPATPPVAAAPPAPAPQVTPPPVVEKPTSFAAATYTNDQYGFTVKYPKSWSNDTLIGDMVMRVAAQPGDLRSDAAATAVVNKPSDYGKAIKDAVDATLAASNINVKTKLESINATTLSDGKTPAMEAVLSADIFGMYELYVYAISTDKGDKTIAAIGLTINGSANKALVKEIAQTLSVK